MMPPMKSASRSFIVICLRHAVGLDDYCLPVLQALVEGLAPDYCEHQPPEVLNVYFANTTENASKADLLIHKIRALVEADDRLRGVKIGRAVSEMQVRLTLRGRLKAAPQGAATAEALKRAMAE